MSIDVEQQCVWVLVICRDRVSEFDAIVKVVIQLLLSNGESHQGFAQAHVGTQRTDGMPRYRRYSSFRRAILPWGALRTAYLG